MPEIIPAILPKSFAELEEKVGLVRGLVDTVQIDFCDGKFVHYKTRPNTEKGGRGVKGEKGGGEEKGIKGVEEKGETGEMGEMREMGGDVDFEAHLMVAEPAPLIPNLVKAGFSRILVHVESFEKGAKGETGVEEKGERGRKGGKRGEDFSELIHEWRGAVEIAAALLIETPLEAIDSFAHELLSVQLMGIAHIGRQGEPFDERVVARVREARTRYPHLAIAVDGGVSLQNVRALLDAGASRLVVGSAIFSPSTGLRAGSEVRGAIEKLRALGYNRSN